MEIQLGVAKVSKYAVRESGDSVEVVERPLGGLSVILVDGQGSGRAAKRLSHTVVNRAVSMIGDGARDGAVVRAVHDYLYHLRDGKVSATLSLISVDLHEGVLVISRNTNSPAFVRHRGKVEAIAHETAPIGIHRMMKPEIVQVPVEADTAVMTFTDGILHAGRRPETEVLSKARDIMAGLGTRYPGAQTAADAMLQWAIEADDGRPRDDMAVAVVQVREVEPRYPIRELFVRYPF